LETIEQLAGTNADAWLSREFAKPTILLLPQVQARVQTTADRFQDSHSDLYWDALLAGDDVLRQRMVFALSQIIVVSDQSINDRPRAMAYYMDILSRNAFGNYKTILEEVTYSPAMASYLTYKGNRKGDEKSGRMPDENYARELLQLFTIGLVELNMDGSVKLGSGGEPIETYTNQDVTNLARVFTGLSVRADNIWGKNAVEDAYFRPLQTFPDEHSPLDKNFLGTTIAGGLPPHETISQSLDHIFAHPNLAPFISRQLIQRLTASHPEPAYVSRVATAFETGTYRAQNGVSFGRGERGDLEATIAAILLDESLVNEPTEVASIASGKVREPILRFVHWARAFNVSSIDASNEKNLGNTSDPGRSLGQHPLRSPSVFNFYRPGYVAPGTETGARSLTAPEFQLVNESSVVGYVNFMTRFVMNEKWRWKDRDRPTYVPDYSREIALADDPAALVSHLDDLLTGGRMSQVTRDRIEEVMLEIPLRMDDPEDLAEDRLSRVHVAVTMAITSPSFIVQR
ncbi:MAG: DUF1800 family protein, partial [Pseudomonadota bacterium]